MGEIADGVINGDFCERCLNPIEDGLPFPHWCEQCVEEKSETIETEDLATKFSKAITEYKVSEKHPELSTGLLLAYFYLLSEGNMKVALELFEEIKEKSEKLIAEGASPMTLFEELKDDE